MTDRISWHQYVRHSDVPTYEAQGWRHSADLGNTHGAWSVLMEWTGEGEPMKQSSSSMSSLAARVLGGYEPSRSEIKSLAASVLSQDTTPGQRIKRAVEKVKALVGR